MAENAALRHQVAVLSGRARRPKLTSADRVVWVLLCRTWRGWHGTLVLVRPETVVGWHRRGFRLFWTWKSRRRRPGRPRVDAESRALVRRVATENTGWGAPRIHGELLKLGVAVSERTVSRLMRRGRRGGSQSWRTFLKNHVGELASMEFFVVPACTIDTNGVTDEILARDRSGRRRTC